MGLKILEGWIEYLLNLSELCNKWHKIQTTLKDHKSDALEMEK